MKCSVGEVIRIPPRILDFSGQEWWLEDVVVARLMKIYKLLNSSNGLQEIDHLLIYCNVMFVKKRRTSMVLNDTEMENISCLS